MPSSAAIHRRPCRAATWTRLWFRSPPRPKATDKKAPLVRAGLDVCSSSRQRPGGSLSATARAPVLRTSNEPGTGSVGMSRRHEHLNFTAETSGAQLRLLSRGPRGTSRVVSFLTALKVSNCRTRARVDPRVFSFFDPFSCFACTHHRRNDRSLGRLKNLLRTVLSVQKLYPFQGKRTCGRKPTVRPEGEGLPGQANGEPGAPALGEVPGGGRSPVEFGDQPHNVKSESKVRAVVGLAA